MDFVWNDYNEIHLKSIEKLLDKSARRSTGMDDGFKEYYDYWINEPETKYGENFWVKVISADSKTIGIMVIGYAEESFLISEYVIAPKMRGKGIGTKALKELLNESQAIIGKKIHRAEAVIYPSNTASQKAFEKAGFKYYHTHEDGDAMEYIYEQRI